MPPTFSSKNMESTVTSNQKDFTMPPTDRPKRKLPIGISDFRMLREEDRHYVDKTFFIRDVIDASGQVLLFPRPRRFGKTLNLSMLRYFLENGDADLRPLFEGLQIAEDSASLVHFGKYPVIYLTFKDLKSLRWEDCFAGIQRMIAWEILRHQDRIGSNTLSSAVSQGLEALVNLTAAPKDYEDSLHTLSDLLYLAYGEKTVILIDEYAAPIHAGFMNGYFEEVIAFMCNFLSGGLKDNTHLFKGVLTGILRVAKESVFSGLNNLVVYTLLDEPFNTAFGFTQAETDHLLKSIGMSQRITDATDWYNGYCFGGETVYNPWSLLNFMDRSEEPPAPYWVNTADPGLIDRLATRGGRELRQEIGILLEGGAIEKPITDAIVLRDLEQGDQLLWSFLLFSGYLKPGKKTGTETWELQIPNREVELIYRRMVRRWFTEKTDSNRIESLLKALTAGEVEDFEELLSGIVRQVLSWHDTARPEPEQFYHAFILGLLVWLEGEYEVRSNRESGLGRYDAMLIPRDRTRKGIVLEFKKVNERRKETPEQALETALKQMESRRYAEELTALGITDILKLALVFRGKELWIREG